MYRARRLTGTYFDSEASRSSPCRVRDPQTTDPPPGKVRRQLMPSGLSSPFSGSGSRRRGKKRAAFLLVVPTLAAKPPGFVAVAGVVTAVLAWSLVVQELGGSTINIARRCSQ